MKTSHKDRIERCLAGETSDRTPIALWRHFPVDDQDPARLAAAVVNYQETFKFDLVKVTPASSFCIKDYGVEDIWKGNIDGTREYQSPLIKTGADWSKVTSLSPIKGSMGAQLECLRLLRDHFDQRTPIVQTIFSPLAQVKNLVGKANLIDLIRSFPDEVKRSLKVLMVNTIDFINECKKLKIDGIFYAVQYAQRDLLSASEFNTFSRTFDVQILDAANDFWLNIIHIHGENIMFEAIADYPAAVINWHDRHTPPALSKGKQLFPGAVCGGIRQRESLAFGEPNSVFAEVINAIKETGGTRYIIGTGCVTPIITPFGNITAAIQAAQPGK